MEYDYYEKGVYFITKDELSYTNTKDYLLYIKMVNTSDYNIKNHSLTINEKRKNKEYFLDSTYQYVHPEIVCVYNITYTNENTIQLLQNFLMPENKFIIKKQNNPIKSKEINLQEAELYEIEQNIYMYDNYKKRSHNLNVALRNRPSYKSIIDYKAKKEDSSFFCETLFEKSINIRIHNLSTINENIQTNYSSNTIIIKNKIKEFLILYYYEELKIEFEKAYNDDLPGFYNIEDIFERYNKKAIQECNNPSVTKYREYRKQEEHKYFQIILTVFLEDIQRKKENLREGKEKTTLNEFINLNTPVSASENNFGGFDPVLNENNLPGVDPVPNSRSLYSILFWECSSNPNEDITETNPHKIRKKKEKNIYENLIKVINILCDEKKLILKEIILILSLKLKEFINLEKNGLPTTTFIDSIKQFIKTIKTSIEAHEKQLGKNDTKIVLMEFYMFIYNINNTIAEINKEKQAMPKAVPKVEEAAATSGSVVAAATSTANQNWNINSSNKETRKYFKKYCEYVCSKITNPYIKKNITNKYIRKIQDFVTKCNDPNVDIQDDLIEECIKKNIKEEIEKEIREGNIATSIIN